MTTPIAAAPSRPASDDQTFPQLTTEQVERVAVHGRIRHVEGGEVLVTAGKPTPKFFVVSTGSIEALNLTSDGEATVTTLRTGQFSGEVTMLSGRRALVTLRVAEPGEGIEVDRGQLLAPIQIDGGWSEVFVRAFLLRRAGLIVVGCGDV